MMLRFLLVVWIGSALMLTGACHGPVADWRGFSVQEHAGAISEATYTAVESLLTEQGYSVEPWNVGDGLIQGRRMLNVPRDATRPRLSTRPSRRHWVEVRFQQRDDRATVRGRVLIQEQDTAAHRVADDTISVSDSYARTAADRDASATAEQWAVWRNVRRDHEAERVLMAALTARLDAPETATNRSTP